MMSESIGLKLTKLDTKMSDIFEQLAEAWSDPANNAELIRQAELEAEIKQIQNED